MSDHAKLKEEYGDLVPELNAMDEETIAQMKRGIPLEVAWIYVNKKQILEHAKTTTKAKTLRDVGSKNHLDTEKGGGGEFEAQINLSDDDIKTWRGVFGKTMTTAQIKEKVSKYKKAAKK
jgi:hypothetical protein